ncbi:Uncharacterised protein [Mycobacteroides abscessus subsp. abscessus]|nr:Uncharacterised protein [Mycobacteroides abscessus subsp. abscessus]SKX24141.1 Uncharacterised protein [Mycobacteroides abscessus subsp. abscessus]
MPDVIFASAKSCGCHFSNQLASTPAPATGSRQRGRIGKVYYVVQYATAELGLTLTNRRHEVAETMY